MLTVDLIKAGILRVRLSVHRNGFFFFILVSVITHQPQGGRISSYLQLHSSRFKSTDNLSSSALRRRPGCCFQRPQPPQPQPPPSQRLIAALGWINAISSPSLWSAARSQRATAAWEYVAGQLKWSRAETISGSVYFLSSVYFESQRDNFAHWQL